MEDSLLDTFSLIATPVASELDDTKLQKSLSLLDFEERPARLFTEDPMRGYTPGPATSPAQPRRSSLRRCWTMTLFSCEVKHPALSMPMQAEVTLEAPKGPKLIMTPTEQRLGTQCALSFKDSRTRSSRAPLHLGVVGGRLLDGSAEHDGKELILERVPPELNGSMYRCTAQNPLGSTDTHTRLIVLENPSMMKGTKNQNNAASSMETLGLMPAVLILTVTLEFT
ncbi:hypothetical protein AOXY_G37827 [Acipenser oxyrinchus oxyrinchus]|uniref:Ig-like domain-containing protein n=1 Tax=Acipenser oxyrinchus oxyrinchus TaxID=40147 RepID=A0AAD8FNS0_ACIOX|nr:hypothetical protein AOXY_G37827 [Acipenser oxyrinchus oxyrinchus]